MKKPRRTTIGLLAIAFVLASCGATEPLAQVRDDVYFMPSWSDASTASTPVHPAENDVVHDYYDSTTAKSLGTGGSYYDVAYNDPQYYNYGRFGFGAGVGMGSMGWMSGWNSPGWGMSMGYGHGMGCGSPFGWYDPWDPWYRPYSCFSPWGMGSMYGWGMGSYYGPYGNCMSCYTPIVVGGTCNTYIGHRPSMGSGGNSDPGGGGSSSPPRLALRDPVSLDPMRRDAAISRTSGVIQRQFESRDAELRPNHGLPAYTNRFETVPRSTLRPAEGNPERGTTLRTPTERSNSQSTQRQRGGFDRGTGGSTPGGLDRSRSSSPSPSPSGGGGGRPAGSPRPR